MTLPPLPSHPEPHTHDWSKLELEAIRKYGEACAAAQPHPLVNLLATALQPFVRFSSDNETISITFRTKDIAFARAALAEAAPAYQPPTEDTAALLYQVGIKMVELTTTVRDPDEWLAIPEIWERVLRERTVAVEELMQLGYTFGASGSLYPPCGELKDAWSQLAKVCLRLGSERSAPVKNESDVPRFVRLPADRGTIDLLDVESVQPGGHYADECTLRMISGITWSVGSGFNKTATDTYNHWNKLVQAAKTAYRR